MFSNRWPSFNQGSSHSTNFLGPHNPKQTNTHTLAHTPLLHTLSLTCSYTHTRLHPYGPQHHMGLVAESRPPPPHPASQHVSLCPHVVPARQMWTGAHPPRPWPTTRRWPTHCTSAEWRTTSRTSGTDERTHSHTFIFFLGFGLDLFFDVLSHLWCL